MRRRTGEQSSGSAVVNVTPGDYFELIARQTSGSTKNVAADKLSWFAIEVVEWRRPTCRSSTPPGRTPGRPLQRQRLGML